MEPTALTFDEITVDQTAEFSVLLTDELVGQFAALSGDYNPLHMDEVYAQTTPLKARVVHGQLSGCLFSRLIGMHLPGRFALYLQQTSTFRAPMRIGMTVTVKGSVIQKTDATKTLTLRTTVTEKGTEQLLVDGKALVNLLQ